MRSPKGHAAAPPTAKRASTAAGTRAAAVPGSRGAGASSSGSWRPGGKLPLSPEEKERGRRLPARTSGNIPGLDYDVIRYTSTFYQGGNPYMKLGAEGGPGSASASGGKRSQQAAGTSAQLYSRDSGGRGQAYSSRDMAEHRTPPYGIRSAGDGGAGGGGQDSPLDDLLTHVNSLLRDFDKMMAKK